MKNKTILFLGASNYFLDAAKYVKKEGYKLIAVDNQELPKAVVKSIADESYSISTIDIEKVYELCINKKVDGIYAGASEVNIPIAIELCERLGLPYYTNRKQWEMSTNKRIFKDKCIEHGINVTETFDIGDDKLDDMKYYPLVTKPVDNNGSTGISICKNKEQLKAGIDKALYNSKSKNILIERYIPSDSVIIQYTIQDGIVKYCGMSDKKSKKIEENAAPVMALQVFPSIHEAEYLENTNAKAIKMIKDQEIEYGAIWIESFYYENKFIFNEIGFRYGGSLTYYPVEYFYGINQMKILINHSLYGNGLYKNFDDITEVNHDKNKLYSILPIQIKPCTIKQIRGIDRLRQIQGVHEFVQSHSIGDIIPASGTTLQVFGYLHVTGNTIEEINDTFKKSKDVLDVSDENDENMLFTIWEI